MGDLTEPSNDGKENQDVRSMIDFDKWFIDPTISQQFHDINKDQSGANLDEIEKQAVINCDKVIAVLSSLKEDGQIDQEIIDIFIRKKHGILITSLSKKGFLRMLSRTDITSAKYDFKGYPGMDKTYKSGFLKKPKDRGAE